MRCKKCGMPISKSRKRCAFCGTPVPQGMSDGAFRTVLCFLMILIIAAVATCYLMYSKGLDPSVWLKRSTPVPSVNSVTPAPSPLPTENVTSKPSGNPSHLLGHNSIEPQINPASQEDDLVSSDLEQLILDGFSRKYSESELSRLSIHDLTLVKYGMYAISGLYFSDSDLDDFFSKLSWYDPNTTDEKAVEERFNSFQSANVKMAEKLIGQ